MPAYTFICFLTLNTESIEAEMPWNKEFVSSLDFYAPVYKQTNKQTHKNRFLGKVTDTRLGEGKTKDEPGISFSARKYGGRS